ncbi:MAG: YaaA family protein [Tenericutes bacterium]|jgi:cytoplasmic iron level regulating protein YaaA (DUF328/UPF0246 family)|nr:YaaA family protein [Mycoplasmatota bacterium]
MKIIVSPSKTQNREHLLNKNPAKLLNVDKTNNLFSIFKDYSKNHLKTIMKINNSLLEETFEIYQNHTSNSLTKKAIRLYRGVAFEQIKLDEYNQKQNQYLNNHLVILSAMYGAIEPNSYIYPYRLDMLLKPKDINLYKYWQHDIDNYFKDEDSIINLASNEFSKMVKSTKDKMLTIGFKDEDENGKYRTISYNAKKARGEMVNQLTLHLITNIFQIKSLIIYEYIYNEQESTNNHLVFIKSYQ